MALPTCDKLLLPTELISLVKSYVWHDLNIKRNKYKVCCSIRQGWIWNHYIKHTQFFFYSNEQSLHYYAFCICGDYLAAITDLSPNARCKCDYFLMNLV